ncbi:hypothetical protein QVD17_19423 [Tagetes erecta]|uniref:Uncharacterized protein n=1 Tax=Tagetes erecta TaxID=13708 RepID=A0AAD8KJD7_TARER|nr:hypothetical protein QVD17_19423 [Tagetes erecta]
MSIGNVPDIALFDYMRDIVNNEEEVDGVYYHISHGEIVNPLDLVDEVPDNLLDDDEYFARHPEDEEDDGNDDGDNDEDSDGDDSNDDGGNDAESESDSEEAEPTKTEIEVVEPMIVEEPVEVASEIEEVAVEKDASIQYVRKKKKVVEKPEEIDVLKIAKTVMAEAESSAQIDKADAGITDPITDDIPTVSPQTIEDIGQEAPIVIPDEAEAETVKMDKAEGKRKIDAIPEIFGDEGSSKKARIDKPVQIEPIQSVAEIEADTEIVSEAETEVFAATDDEKEVNSGDTVQIEPIQSEAGETVDKPETGIVAEVASQFEPVQTDDAPMIEALDDLDIDWTESEDEAEPEPVQHTVEEIPNDLAERFAYLERMKFKSGFA